MAYTNGAAANIEAFLNAIRAFASAQCGFTDLGTEVINSRKVHKLSKGGLYYSFMESNAVGNNVRRSTLKLTFVEPTAITGWGTANNVPEGQYGQGVFSTFLIDGPFTGYYLFTDETLAVHCVLEVASGLFTHVSFGSIEKTGTFDGGEYLLGQDIYYRAPTDFIYARPENSYFFTYDYGNGTYDERGVMRYSKGGANSYVDFAPFGSAALVDQQAFGSMPINWQAAGINTTTPYNYIITALKSPYNLRSMLLPLPVMLKDQGGSLKFIAGVVKDARLVNMEFLNGGEIVDTDWQVFPCSAKTGYDKTVGADSGIIGIAYKRTGLSV